MTEQLKTLKDIEILGLKTQEEVKELLKKEAIKWIKHFFNLTEEDLK